jgi:hypothetical protein
MYSFITLSKNIFLFSIFSDIPVNPDHQLKEDEVIQNIRFDIGIISYRQWLDKLGNLKTILNIAPFTLTGDITRADRHIDFSRFLNKKRHKLSDFLSILFFTVIFPKTRVFAHFLSEILSFLGIFAPLFVFFINFMRIFR